MMCGCRSILTSHHHRHSIKVQVRCTAANRKHFDNLLHTPLMYAVFRWDSRRWIKTPLEGWLWQSCDNDSDTETSGLYEWSWMATKSVSYDAYQSFNLNQHLAQCLCSNITMWSIDRVNNIAHIIHCRLKKNETHLIFAIDTYNPQSIYFTNKQILSGVSFVCC